MDLSKVTKPQVSSFLIVFSDIQNFLGIARALPDPLATFELLDSLGKLIIAEVGSAGVVVKFIGDASLIIFPEEAVDAGVRIILRLKEKAEQFLASRGFKNELKITAHFGEAAVGPFGDPAKPNLDIMGDSVNTASSLGRAEHRGRVIISPQVFRKLSPATRTLFHRYTPPIVYLAEA